jgi:zinc protease
MKKNSLDLNQQQLTKTMKKILSLLFLTIQLGFAQQIQLTDKLPMNPAVKVGKLKNGLTYYIHKNAEPAKRAQLRLVVKTGSILEDENQRGLAHFMEHMNFNGTKNFPKNELLNFLEKSGIQFGADLNAYTSFDETVYMLPVPTDTLAKLERFMSVLSDWAAYATLDPSEIDKERGVILEEARTRKGAQSRIQEKLLPVIFNGSKYASRLPIGTDEVIQNAPYALFNKFYKDWYRPDLQAVVAVGDFDVAVMEAMINKYFGKIKKAKKAKERTKFSVPLKGGTEAIVITDSEQPNNIVQVYYLKPETKTNTASEKRADLVVSLFNTMINNRMQELLQKANPPFRYGGSSYGQYLADLDAVTLVAVAKGAEVETALKAVLDENERAVRFGFTDGELGRAKQNMKTRMEKQVLEKNKTDSDNYVDEYVDSFLNDEPSTSEEFDLAFANQFLEGIKVDEVNALIKKLMTKENRVLALIGSEKDKESLPTVAQLKTWLDNTGTANLTAYVDEKVAGSLLEKTPVAGKIKSETKVAEVGVTELMFENGVKVNLKPTDFKNDEILFTGKSYGGSSLYDDADFDNASFSSRAAGLSGNGALNATQLKKFMSGKVASVNATVGENSESINGSSSVKDIETALQMIHNKFVNNKLDAAAVKGALANQTASIAGLEKTPVPDKVFFDTLQTVAGGYAYRAKPITSARLEKVDIDKAFGIFNDRFKDASDFEFTFVGNFDIEKMKPLLATYLGGLPTSGVKELYKDRKIETPKGRINKVVKAGKENKATVLMLMHNTYTASDKEDLQIALLGEILNIKLTERLREQEGGVYTPQVAGNGNRIPTAKFVFSIYFPCSPANVDKLSAMSLQEFEKIVKDGPDAVDVEKVLSKKTLDLQTAVKTNGYWLGNLSTAYQQKEDVKKILAEGDLLKSITKESLKAAAQKYLKGENILKVVLLPEDK